MCYGGTSLAMDHRASCHGSFRISLLGVARTFEGGKGDRRRDCSNNCSQAEAKSFKGGGFNCEGRSKGDHLFLGIISLLLEKIAAFSSRLLITIPLIQRGGGNLLKLVIIFHVILYYCKERPYEYILFFFFFAFHSEIYSLRSDRNLIIFFPS